MKVLNLEDIQRLAPSVFAQEAYNKMSDKYRFFPTIDVVTGLMDSGFMPVRARQSRTRIEGKENFTRHVLRSRHNDLLNMERGEEVPEIVLTNSHDGTSAYRLSLGFFRVVCSNGLVVQSSQIQDIRVRHSGADNLIENVIEGSFEIVKEAPKAIAQIEDWKATGLTYEQREAFAGAAVELLDSSLEITPKSLLTLRRAEDNGSDLWKTLNVVQENIIKGGVVALNSKKRRRHTREVKSVQADSKLNRALWVLAEGMKGHLATAQAA